ncbi:MAG: peptidoglycan DD-metalloendopeptidase family protein [Verrucomicrobiales bacterium]|nr:peptidoglycan DD-metalloendopeptidase family protein [Verrucomicrobiales bacterium]
MKQNLFIMVLAILSTCFARADFPIYTGTSTKMFSLPIDVDPNTQSSRYLTYVDQYQNQAGWLTWNGISGSQNTQNNNGGSYSWDSAGSHGGTDFYCPLGTGVVSAASGTVIHIRDGFPNFGDSWNGRGFGNSVVIDHGNGITAIYAHLNKSTISVALGESVSAGQHIADVGMSGSGSSYHLHFQVNKGAGYPYAHYVYPSDAEAYNTGYYNNTPDYIIDPYSQVSTRQWWITQNAASSGYKIIPAAASAVTPPNIFNPFPDIADDTGNGYQDVAVDWGYTSGDPANTVYRLQISKDFSTYTSENGFTTNRFASGNIVVNHVIQVDNSWGSGSSFIWDASQAGTLYHSSSGTQLSVSEAPQPNTTYYYCVYAYNTVTGQRSNYSARQAFTTSSTTSPTLSLSSSSSSWGPSSVSSSFTVNSTGTWTWSSSTSWLTSSESSPQSNDQTFTYNVAANSSTSSRTGYIYFYLNGSNVASFTVTQSGASPTLSLSSSSNSLISSGGSSSFTVNSNSTWTWSSSSSWLTSSESSSQTGNQTFSYSVVANTSTSSRTGYIYFYLNGSNVASFTVTQSGAAVQTVDLYDDGESYQSISATSVQAGGTLTVQSDVRNGGTAASGSFAVKVYLSTNTTISSSDTLLGTVSMSSIDAVLWANADLINATVPSSLAAGTYYVGWIIDAANQVSESNEDNNTVLYKSGSQTLTVTAAPSPDIGVRYLNDIPNGGSFTTPGRDYTAGTFSDNFQVYNHGNAPLIISSMTSSNPTEFAVVVESGPPSLDAGTTGDYWISFDPSAVGTRSAQITIRSNDPDEDPFVFTIYGEGLPPAPSKAINPTPVNGAIGWGINDLPLSWESGGNATRFSVMMNTTGVFPPASASNSWQAAMSSSPQSLGLGDTLQYGTTYYWRVDTSNDSVTWQTGDVWHFTTASGPQSLEITSPSLNESVYPGSPFTLIWTSSNVPSLSSISISIFDGDQWMTVVSSTPNDGIETILVPSGITIGNYGAKVAIWLANNGAVFDYSDQIVIGGVMPESPASMSASDGNSFNGITISWSSVLGATEYSVYRHEGNAIIENPQFFADRIARTASSSWDDTTAVEGTLYRYYVFSHFHDLTSIASASDTGFRAIVLNPPSGVNASDGTSSSEVVIDWDSVMGATSYSVFRGVTNSDVGLTEIGSVSGNRFVDTSGVIGSTYWYFIRANNAGGSSGFSVGDSGYVFDGGDDHGNSPSSATVAAGNAGKVLGELSSSDVDYFRIDTTEAGTLVVWTESGIDTVGVISDDLGNTLDSNDDNDDRTSWNFRISSKVGVGSFFVSVSGFAASTSGPYVLHYRFIPSGNLVVTDFKKIGNDVIIRFIGESGVVYDLMESNDLDNWRTLFSISGTSKEHFHRISGYSGKDRNFFRVSVSNPLGL